MSKPFLDRTFFQRDPVTCARELIGCELVWNSCAGIIVETEAYAALNDEACHTFFRPSARKFIADHQPGAAYVYFNYGMYWLLNVLVKGGSEDGFVLLRALEPTRGLETMRDRRFPESRARVAAGSPDPKIEAYCSGPGKLTIALGVDGQDHGRDLCSSEAVGFAPAPPGSRPAVADVRVGISKAVDLPWRFLAEQNTHISTRSRRKG